MIDYVRIYAFGLDRDKLLKEKRFSFSYKGKVETGDITGYYGKWRDMAIVINLSKEYIIFKGSLHKYYHGHNHSQFTFQNYLECLELLNEDFGIISRNTVVKRLEFGVNVHTSRHPREIAERIIAYKNKRFIQMEKGDRGILGVHCTMDKMKIKIYDKGKHYDLRENILRFEVVTKKMVQMHKIWKIDVYSLEDLKCINKWNELSQKLVDIFDGILIDELETESILSTKEQILHLKFHNSDGFERTRNELSKKNHRNTFRNQVKKFEEIQRKYGQRIKETLVMKIKDVSRRLFDRNCANAPNSNNRTDISKNDSNCAKAQLDNIVHLHKATDKDYSR